RLRRAEELFVKLGNGPWRLRVLAELSRVLAEDSPEEAHARMETARQLARELGLPGPDAMAVPERGERASVLSLEAANEIWSVGEPNPVTALDALRRLIVEVAGPGPAELQLAPGTRADFAESAFDPYARERDRRGRLHVSLGDRGEAGRTIEIPLLHPGDLLRLEREASASREEQGAVLRLAGRWFGAWLDHACEGRMQGRD